MESNKVSFSRGKRSGIEINQALLPRAFRLPTFNLISFRTQRLDRADGYIFARPLTGRAKIRRTATLLRADRGRSFITKIQFTLIFYRAVMHRRIADLGAAVNCELQPNSYVVY